MTVSVVFAIAGVIALLFGIIGGGIKAKEIEVPLLSKPARIITIAAGLILISVTLWLEISKKNQPVPVENIAAVTSLPTSAPVVESPTAPQPTATLMPAPTGTPQTKVLPNVLGWHTVVLDDFSKDNDLFWQGKEDDLECGIADAKYTCTLAANTATTHWLWESNIELKQKFLLSVEVKLVNGPEESQCGLLFRRLENAEYTFMVRNDGYFQIFYHEGEREPIINWKQSSTIKQGETNLLTVVADGSQYWFLINGDQVAYIEDDRLSLGAPGVAVYSDVKDQPAVFQFDQFEVRAP